MVIINVKPDYEGAKRETYKILGRLDPPLYPFHHRGHTFDYVMPAIEILAAKLRIHGEEKLILRTGGAYHDTGFVQRYWHNEPIGVEIAEKTLPNYLYSDGQIKKVGGIIMATQLPQLPQTLLEEVMCDADLYNLGGNEFWSLGECLLREWMMHKNEIPQDHQPPEIVREFYEGQLKFLRSHTYHTKAAQSLRDKGKQKNIRELENLFNSRK